MKSNLFNILALLKIGIAFSAFALLGCPYIDHGTTDAPEKASAEDIQGCYYSEQFSEDTYSDKNLPREDDPAYKGGMRRYDKLFCKKMCFEGDSVVVNVRGFAMPYDTDGQYVEDTIPYIIRRTYSTYDTTEYGIVEKIHSEDTGTTIYEEKFPVLFMEPAIDGVFSNSVQTNFPTDLDAYHEYYENTFKLNVHFDNKGDFSREKGYKKFTVSTYYHEEVFSSKGWDICRGF